MGDIREGLGTESQRGEETRAVDAGINKIPFKFVRLNGRRWEIQLVDQIMQDGTECVGLCETANRRILLQIGSLGKLQDTLFHEMVHASCPSLTEEQVCEVERGVYAMLADNPKVRNWLFKNADSD